MSHLIEFTSRGLECFSCLWSRRSEPQEFTNIAGATTESGGEHTIYFYVHLVGRKSPEEPFVTRCDRLTYAMFLERRMQRTTTPGWTALAEGMLGKHLTEPLAVSLSINSRDRQRILGSVEQRLCSWPDRTRDRSQRLGFPPIKTRFYFYQRTYYTPSYFLIGAFTFCFRPCQRPVDLFSLFSIPLC